MDDDLNLMGKLERTLTNKGYKVYPAKSWAEVNDFVFKEKVLWLMCEVNMYGGSGESICKVFKETIPHMKVIFYSSLPETDLREICQNAGADGYIIKTPLIRHCSEQLDQLWDQHQTPPPRFRRSNNKKKGSSSSSSSLKVSDL